MQPSEKLTKTNHTVWYAQVRATLRGAKMMSYLNSDSTLPPTHVPTIGADGKEIKVDEKVHMVPNPEYEDWDAADQQVLSHLHHVGQGVGGNSGRVRVPNASKHREHSSRPWNNPQRDPLHHRVLQQDEGFGR
jgi:hypothetical protein